MNATIDGAALLDEVEAFHRRFNVFPTEHAYVAVALWDAHAHLMDALDGTARIAFLSPEPGSGKSRALEIIETLTPRAATTVNASANALFRLVSAEEGTPRSSSTRSTPCSGPKPAATKRSAGSSTPATGAAPSPCAASAMAPTRRQGSSRRSARSPWPAWAPSPPRS